MDFSGLIASTDTMPAATAIVAIGSLIVLPLVAAFTVRYLLRMVSENQDDKTSSGDDDDHRQDIEDSLPRERFDDVFYRFRHSDRDP